MKSPRHRLAAGVFLFLVLPGLALVSARSFAGSSNDGSRLATVESLVDYHTLAIDRSIFVPPASATIWPPPYPPEHPLLACSQVVLTPHNADQTPEGMEMLNGGTLSKTKLTNVCATGPSLQ